MQLLEREVGLAILKTKKDRILHGCGRTSIGERVKGFKHDKIMTLLEREVGLAIFENWERQDITWVRV